VSTKSALLNFDLGGAEAQQPPPRLLGAPLLFYNLDPQRRKVWNDLRNVPTTFTHIQNSCFTSAPSKKINKEKIPLTTRAKLSRYVVWVYVLCPARTKSLGMNPPACDPGLKHIMEISCQYLILKQQVKI
jgi:hypothetical protein